MRQNTTPEADFVTIIAPTAAEAMHQFKAQGLDRQGYTITGPIGRHRFALAEGAATSDPFAGRVLIAATFCRRC